MTYKKERTKVILVEHYKFPLKLMIEFEPCESYFYVEYGEHKIGLVKDKIGPAQILYKHILEVLKLESQGVGR